MTYFHNVGLKGVSTFCACLHAVAISIYGVETQVEELCDFAAVIDAEPHECNHTYFGREHIRIG